MEGYLLLLDLSALFMFLSETMKMNLHQPVKEKKQDHGVLVLAQDRLRQD